MRTKFDIYKLSILLLLNNSLYFDSYSHLYNSKGRKTHNTEQYKQITIIILRQQNTGKRDIANIREMNSHNKPKVRSGRFDNVIFSHSVEIVATYSLIAYHKWCSMFYGSSLRFPGSTTLTRGYIQYNHRC